jgi:phosphoserine phosphatase
VTGFRSVVLDVDSTLCGVEGIDWLAERRGPDVARRIRELTERAMDGEIALDSVYGERLALIRPTVADIAALAQLYRATIAPGAESAIEKMKRAGVRVVLVSGGIRQAIEPLASDLDVELRAVELVFDRNGGYAGFDSASPLATQSGKLEVVRSLALARPALAVGDGSTDVAMRDGVDRFVAFTGFTSRAAVIANADAVAQSFDELTKLALGR